MTDQTAAAEPLLTLRSVSKSFRRYRRSWHRLIELISFGRIRTHQDHWALRDISLQVQTNQSLGIIGLNGAGKSTLLKLIVGTLRPTKGEIVVTPDVGALLELGMGFHPDFTGRENLMTAGQLMGMTRQQVEQVIPQIEAFAEIGDYLDQPVRIYSSGMQMRLAFALAVSRRPRLLIVDEALSVGDAYFQNKSFEKIRELRKAGTSLLLVSHDQQAILSFCDRAILLDAGHMAAESDPQSVLDLYNARLSSAPVIQTPTGASPQTRSGDGRAQITQVGLWSAEGSEQPLQRVGVGQLVELRVRLQTHASLPNLTVGFLIKDRLGLPIFGTNTHQLGVTLPPDQQGDTRVYCFRFPCNLGPGQYSISVAAHEGLSHVGESYDWIDFALEFLVFGHDQPAFVGCAYLQTKASVAYAS